MPTAGRGRLRPPAGAELLAAIATVAFVAGVALAVLAADFFLATGVPLWDAVLVVSVLSLLASVLRFPEWWGCAGGWSPDDRACAGGRRRRASQTVDLCRARSPRTRKRPDRPEAHALGGAHPVARRATGAALAGGTTHSKGAWLLVSRRRESMPRVQGPHGRPRG